jgi:hypothetical protein
MEAALGNSKDYSLKQYLLFADKLQTKAKVSECLLLVNYIIICSCMFQARKRLEVFTCCYKCFI